MPVRTPAAAAALAAAALLLAACGAGDGPAAESAGEPAEPVTRTVTHAAGTTEVPTDPQRIVTTTDQNALLPLLELGVTPVGSAGLLDPATGERSFRRTEGFDTSGVEFTGAYGEPNLEAVAALDPDLVVGYEFDEDFHDDLSAIAPTVLVQIFDRPLDEALLEFGDLVGRGERAEELQAEHEARVEAIRTELASRGELPSVSVITAGDPGQYYRADTGQAIGTVMDAVGLPRPDALLAAAPADEALSLERLAAAEADVVYVVDFTGDGQDPGFSTLVESPLYDRLAAVRAGQAHVVDGSTTVGAAWARMGAFLDVLEETLVETEVDTAVVEGEVAG